MAKPVKVDLSSPIQGSDGPIKTLEIREPLFGDIVQHGYPFSVKDGEVDNQKLLNLLEACTGHHAPILKRMSLADSLKVTQAFMEFMGESEETVGNESTTSSSEPSGG